MTSQECLERRVGRFKVLTITMLALLAVAVAIAVVIIVTVRQSKSSTAAAVETSSDIGDCADIAVIGSGIGGAYTAWRLRKHNLSISVYEYSDRVGGRLLSVTLPAAPGVSLELGGMRFLPKTHKIFNTTATALGLNIIDFPLGFGPFPERLWYLRGTNMRAGDLLTDKYPYNVDPDEEGPLGAMLWNVFSKAVNFSSNTAPSVDETYSLVTNEGTPLYKISLDNFYGEYMSQEAYNALLGLTGLEFSTGEHTAVFAMSYVFFTGAQETLKTIDGGMEKVPETLMEEFLESSDRHNLYLNHQLVGIDRSDGGYKMRFRKTKTSSGITTPDSESGEITMCAKKVVIAAQKSCVENIDFPVFKNDPEIMRTIDSVFDHKAGKVFLAYNTPWWKANHSDITNTKTDLPNRQTYDWSIGTNISIIMATYHDGKIVDYWRELSKFGTPIPGSLPGAFAVTDVVKDRLEKYLSVIYDIKQEDIPEAVGGAMMLWDSYPFQGAWNHYKPGFDEREVQRRIQKPSPNDDVFIVSNSWASAELGSWAEGTLEAAEDVIQKYLVPSK